MYEKLWRKVGGKPWTEIVREDQKISPLIYLLIFLGLGILVARLAGKYWWQIWLDSCWVYFADISGGKTVEDKFRKNNGR